MRLYEIERSIPLDNIDIDLTKSDQNIIGKFKEFDILISNYFPDKATIMIADGDDVIGLLALSNEPENINGTDYHEMSRIWVSPNHRGKRIAEELRNIAKNTLGLKTMSDLTMTDDGIKNTEKSIASGKFNISYYNIDTGEITEVKPKNLYNSPSWRVLYD